MVHREVTTDAFEVLTAKYGPRLQREVPLSRFTSARVGGPAEALLVVENASQLAEAAACLWEMRLPVTILGSGSNVLISDMGLPGVVLINHARQVQFIDENNQPQVWAESGANLGAIARKAVSLGFSGLEWAVGIPGSLGGALVGNAGAHGGDMAGVLILADILQPSGVDIPGVTPVREEWPVEKFQYTYRSSCLKGASRSVVLSARLRLERSTIQETEAKADAYNKQRQRTQPPGASMGSMFKNPPGDYAGRLIEACGLKGIRRGEAEISPLHANFFINRGGATAADVRALLETARQTVSEKFGIHLELEIELLGLWDSRN